MTLEEFIQVHDVHVSNDPIQEKDIPLMEVYLEAKIGPQLQTMLLQYGLLSYRSAEIFGIVNRRGPKSRMVAETRMLHEYCPKTRGLIAFESMGDGEDYLVDDADNVYRYTLDNDTLTLMGMKLFTYILQPFESLADME